MLYPYNNIPVMIFISNQHFVVLRGYTISVD